MSYILEALKKSEEERKKGAVPNLSTASPEQVSNSRSRSIWSCVIALSLFLNAGIFMWWLRPWQKELTPGDFHVSTPGKSPSQLEFSAAEPQLVLREDFRSSPSQSLEAGGKKERDQKQVAQNWSTGIMAGAENSTLKPGKLTSPSDSPDRAPPLSLTGDSTTLEQPVAKKDHEAQSQHDSKPIGALGDMERFPNQGSPSMPSRTAKPEDTAAPLTESTSGGKGFREMIAKHLDAEIERMEKSRGDEKVMESQSFSPSLSLPPAQPFPSTGRPFLESEGGSRALEGLPTVNELPAPLRNQLSEISFSGYVYSKSKSDRMIIINGRVRREGDEIRTGLKLEEIRPDGAIFNYNGTRFLKSL